jgi:hypothetical protein
MARRARAGDSLVAATRPEMPMLDTAFVRRPPGWPPHPWQPRMVTTLTPGSVSDEVEVSAAGRYRAWVAGSFTRPIDVLVDGRRIGQASGVNNLGQWLPGGEVTLSAGMHRLGLLRGGGRLSPGDGYYGDLGPLVLEPIGRDGSLRRLAPDRARELCGSEWDWIELVRG